MAGPASPGSEGPTFAPPQLPPGWIAQWDGSSRKYYFVQLSTGVSQWETPTDAAPVGGGDTPASNVDHPYGVPGQTQLITHPDGTQTVKHADGTMEPIMPAEDGARAVDGATGERGLGTFALNALMSGRTHQGGSSSPLGQLVGGLTHSGGSHNAGGNLGGKLVGQLASNLFSGNKPQQPQNYYGGQSANPQNAGGVAGTVLGGVANMFGGGTHPSNSGGQNYGYSNSGQGGGYAGQAPPTSYQPPSVGSYPPPPQASSYQPPPPSSQPPPQTYLPPGQQPHFAQAIPGQAQQSPSFPPPPSQPIYGQGSNPGLSQQQPNYGTPQGQPSYGIQPPQFGSPTSNYNPPYAGIPPPPPPAAGLSYGSQPSYGAPPIPHGSRPHHGQGYGTPY